MEQQTAVTERPPLEIPSSLKNLVEALIFAALEPLTFRQIKAIYEQEMPEGEERRLEQSEVQQIIGELNQEYQKADKAYRIIAIAGGFQFATMKQYAEWIGRLSREQSRRKLSQSSLESLAIIAYKQPVSKPEIESIRGVNCDYVLKTLLEKELVTIVGRAETVGRPLLYGTTREFLKHFGLNEITDLPRPREIEEILGESQFETERRMLEAAAGAEEMKKEEEDFKSRLPHIPKKKPELDEQVQILPKTRRRKIAVRKQEEESVQTSQEPLTFTPETTTPPRDAAETTNRAETSIDTPAGDSEIFPTEQKETKEIVPGRNRLSLVDLEEMGQRAPTSGVDDTPAGHTTSETSAGDYPVEQEDLVPEVPDTHSATHDSPLEPELPQPRRSRWINLKEKIQIFIKKLFA